MRTLIFACLVACATPASAAVLRLEGPLGWEPPQVQANPNDWLQVDLLNHYGWAMDIRANDLPGRYVPVADRFWIARTTPTFRMIQHGWRTDHDISAYLAAPTLTFEVFQPVGTRPIPGTQTFRYNGDEVTLTTHSVPEPAAWLLAAYGVGVFFCRKHA